MARRLTPKQKEWANKVLKNPKQPLYKAAQGTYGREGKELAMMTAAAISSENLKKPQIMAYLHSHATEAESILIEAMGAERKQYGFNPQTKTMELLGSEPDHAIRLRAADSILDRVHGKATQRIESTNQTVVFSIDLTGTTDTE